MMKISIKDQRNTLTRGKQTLTIDEKQCFDVMAAFAVKYARTYI